MDVNTIIMVEKKLSLESVTTADNNNLEMMMESELFQKDIAWFQDFMLAINDLGIQDLKSKMELWKEDLDLKEMSDNGTSTEEQFTTSVIPHAALERLFAPNPSYEMTMKFATRGNAIVLRNVENGFEWNQNNRKFELEKGCSQLGLAYRLENNQTQVIKDGMIDVEGGSFNLSLDLDIMLPGKYYLKLIVGSQMIMHSFYIQKELMPSLIDLK